ncbi:MAG: type II secretion system protein [Coriobacteriia bacterium]|nr:type II secretion system protein [Coriobacteriia bacterium]
MKTNRRHTFIYAENGFTLVELMVTVLILGLLVTMAVGLFNNSIQKDNQKACAANVDTINLAVARAALISGKPISAINDTDVNAYITRGITSLECSVKSHPATYHVVQGVINPLHNHQ